ncbi:hypothetical protein [Microbulbifer aggregans]|uniref:hypothetical protein n=1 Tax=Microbulbifer aggregans TaxID=1769779 RepID=UPI001CFEF9D8|nr:hypothetical protein [Microbulbifer aggregans]
MRKSAGIAEVGRKYEEINRSLLSHQISAVLFGFSAFFSIPTALLSPDIKSVSAAVFASLISMQARKGKKTLKAFKHDFLANPKKYARRRIPKPIM